MSTDTTTWREKIGMGLIVVSGIILAESYWQYRGVSEFLRAIPLLAICFISAAGGGLGGWLVGKTPPLRLQAMVAAALLNFGGMFSFQHMFETSSRLGSAERLLGFGLGALPGIILGGVFIYRHEKRLKAQR
ncbi:MAG: hypothetical protein PSU94_17470 [Lacunisphaera sp.]|nr:hypothetical protein [Lacunisphaera sp.]